MKWNPGLSVFYVIWPGNGSGLLYSSCGPYGASTLLTLSSPVVSNGYTSKRSGPYWSNSPFFIFLTFGHYGAQDWESECQNVIKIRTKCIVWRNSSGNSHALNALGKFQAQTNAKNVFTTHNCSRTQSCKPYPCFTIMINKMQPVLSQLFYPLHGRISCRQRQCQQHEEAWFCVLLGNGHDNRQ